MLNFLPMLTTATRMKDRCREIVVEKEICPKSEGNSISIPNKDYRHKCLCSTALLFFLLIYTIHDFLSVGQIRWL